MSFGDDVIAAAGRYLGMTYSWGGGDYNGPTKGIRDGGVADQFGDYDRVGFDCSGLVLYAVAQASDQSIQLPHRADLQRRMGDAVPMGAQQPGDIAYFGTNSFVHHTGIFIGNGQIRNAPQSGSPIADMKLSRWSDLFCFRRFGTPANGSPTPDPTVVEVAHHHPQEDWFTMATRDDLKGAIRELMPEIVGAVWDQHFEHVAAGDASVGDILAATLNELRDTRGELNALPTAVWTKSITDEPANVLLARAASGN